MALNESIIVVEQSAPWVYKQLTDFRKDSIVSDNGATNANNIVTITGYTFQLVIKREPTGVRAQDGYPQVFDADSTSKIYTGMIEGDPQDGTFKFELDLAATACSGDYPAEIRWWKFGASTAGIPSDRVAIRFIVEKALDQTYT